MAARGDQEGNQSGRHGLFERGLAVDESVREQSDRAQFFVGIRMAQGRVHHVPEFFAGQRAGGHPRRQLKAHPGANSLASAAIDHSRPRTHPHAPRVLVDAAFDPNA